MNKYISKYYKFITYNNFKILVLGIKAYNSISILVNPFLIPCLTVVYKKKCLYSLMHLYTLFVLIQFLKIPLFSKRLVDLLHISSVYVFRLFWILYRYSFSIIHFNTGDLNWTIISSLNFIDFFSLRNCIWWWFFQFYK